MTRPALQLARVGACLALGVCTTIAVALLAACYGRWSRGRTIDAGAPVRFGSDAYPIVRRPGETRTGLGVRYRQIWWHEAGELSDRYAWIRLLITDEETLDYGWPMYALATPPLGLDQVRSEPELRQAFRRARAQPNMSFLPEWMGVWSETRLPTHVRPVGFAVCTLFWGAVGGMVLTLHRSACRRWRRRRGLCESCRYPLIGLGRCPECGGPCRSWGDP